MLVRFSGRRVWAPAATPIFGSPMWTARARTLPDPPRCKSPDSPESPHRPQCPPRYLLAQRATGRNPNGSSVEERQHEEDPAERGCPVNPRRHRSAAQPARRFEREALPDSYRLGARLFGRAVERAQEGLRAAGKDASRRDGYTWHSNRHTFASRLVMAGVDLSTMQELGGWKTLSMRQRYSHLAPGHLQSAVERLVRAETRKIARNWPAAGIGRASPGLVYRK